MNEEKTKKKFNKKKLMTFGILGVFALALVSAVIFYSATINVTADITEPFVTTTIPLSFSGVATDTIYQEISITNNADTTLPATITWLPRSDGLVVPDLMEITQGEYTFDLLDGIQVIPIPSGLNIMTVSFSTQGANIGALNLAKKTVDFDKEIWDVLVDQVTMQYSKIGDKFTAEVTTGANSDYVLIYYADAVDRFDNPENAILVEDVEGDLPYANDANADYYDYSEEYGTAHGAKIWYVPSDAIDEGELDWSRASEFYFETDLITYTQSDTDSIGIITVQRVEA